MEQNRDRKYSIANQMIRGNGNLATNKELVIILMSKYPNLLQWLDENLPKKISYGVLAAFGKAILWHGLDSISGLAYRLKNLSFNGINDNAHKFWLAINRSKKQDIRGWYAKTITLIRYEIKGNKLKEFIKPARDDFFEWSEDFEYMRSAGFRNQHTVYYEEDIKACDL